MIYQPNSREFVAMLNSYMGCLLWTMPGDDGDENPGDRFSIDRFTKTAKIVCVADCLEFLNRVQVAKLSPWVWQTMPKYRLIGYGPDQLGYDLAFSRNGHGSGFFDRNVLDVQAFPDYMKRDETLGDALQEIAGNMGQRDIYPARGWIHCS